MKKFFTALLLLFFIPSIALTQKTKNWQSVEETLGKKGTIQGDVYKITYPRFDLEVKLEEVSIDAGLSFTSWIAFKPMENHKTLMMGDLVLLEYEITPVIKILESKGINITALHNHLVRESPKVMFMHFKGKGDPEELVKIMKSALAATDTPLSSSETTTQQSTINIDWQKVESILGEGNRKANLLKYGFPRAETITVNGTKIPPAIGTATAIGFQALGKDKVATYGDFVLGDFVLLDKEVNALVKALIESGINVTALHNHMLFESPRLFYMHFGEWEGLKN